MGKRAACWDDSHTKTKWESSLKIPAATRRLEATEAVPIIAKTQRGSCKEGTHVILGETIHDARGNSSSITAVQTKTVVSRESFFRPRPPFIPYLTFRHKRKVRRVGGAIAQRVSYRDGAAALPASFRIPLVSTNRRPSMRVWRS